MLLIVRARNPAPAEILGRIVISLTVTAGIAFSSTSSICPKGN
jgi:hypothetical protein